MSQAGCTRIEKNGKIFLKKSRDHEPRNTRKTQKIFSPPQKKCPLIEAILSVLENRYEP